MSHSHMSNPLVSPEQLYRRSSFSALPADLLDVIFFSTQCLTQAAGLLLQLPQSVTAQANVLLARYWLVEPPMDHEFSDISAASIYIVAKMGPFPRSPRDVTNVYAYLLSPSSPLFHLSSSSPPSFSGDGDSVGQAKQQPPAIVDDPSSYFLTETEYEAARARLLALEARVLYALGFDTHVALPHWLAVTYLQALGFLSRGSSSTNSNNSSGDKEETSDGRDISRRALAYLNTALLSPQLLYLTHQPPALAVAAVYAAARDCGVRMPACEWWEVFDVDREELGFLVVAVRSVEGWWVAARGAGSDDARKGEGEKAAPAMRLLRRGGAVTRRDVREELARRGLGVSAGVGNKSAVADDDPEAEMMRRMDERIAQMEAEKEKGAAGADA